MSAKHGKGVGLDGQKTGGTSASSPALATFTDRYGDERTIHKTHSGLRIKRQGTTPILAINPVVGAIVGGRIRALRIERGMSMKELAEKCGMKSGHPKNRIYEIEVGARQEGLRFGTLYVLAMALGVEVYALMPTVAEVREASRVAEVYVEEIGLLG